MLPFKSYKGLKLFNPKEILQPFEHYFCMWFLAHGMYIVYTVRKCHMEPCGL
jgi:hypothetical protein